MNSLFFQSSMPRSGSTMLQNIIAQNPDFYVTPTSGVLELVFGARANFTNSLEFKAQDSEQMKKAFLSFCRYGIDGYFKALTDKKYVIDKSRGWIAYRGFLESFYPNPKIICMVRDLRSVISSYEKIYRKNQYLSDSIRNDETAEGTTIHKRVDIYLNPQHTIGRALERIQESFNLNYAHTIHFVRYEDLCNYPNETMKGIYSYLDVDYFQHDFQNIDQITVEDDSIYGMGSDLHSIKKELKLPNSDHVEILGNNICQWIQYNYSWYFETFNYQ